MHFHNVPCMLLYFKKTSLINICIISGVPTNLLTPAFKISVSKSLIFTSGFPKTVKPFKFLNYPYGDLNICLGYPKRSPIYALKYKHTHLGGIANIISISIHLVL